MILDRPAILYLFDTPGLLFVVVAGCLILMVEIGYRTGMWVHAEEEEKRHEAVVATRDDLFADGAAS